MGKDAEGRAEPVKIKLRPKGVGIGFSDDEPEPESEEEEERPVKTRVKVENVAKQHSVEVPPLKRQHHSSNENDFEIEEQQVRIGAEVKIIDMQRPDQTFALSSILKEISINKRREKAELGSLQNELESSLRQLKRNIEEVEKERNRLIEIETKNEKKRCLKEFIDGKEEFRNNFDLLCTRLTSIDQTEIVNVLIPILKENESEIILNIEKMEKLKSVLNPEIYSQIIFYLWWPLMRSKFSSSIEDEETWKESIGILKIWSNLLPTDFLFLFIGNQILIPRLHTLLSINTNTTNADIIILVWEFLKCKLEIPLDVLKGDIFTWLAERISKTSIKNNKFECLVEEFVKEWQGKRLIPSEDLKKLKETSWIQRTQKLLQRDLIIDPADQDLLPLECTFLVYKSEIISKPQIIQLLTDHLIPKLKRCVQIWLKSPDVDFEEVAEWYVAWKDLMPGELIEEASPLINGFAEILNVINDSL